MKYKTDLVTISPVHVNFDPVLVNHRLHQTKNEEMVDYKQHEKVAIPNEVKIIDSWSFFDGNEYKTIKNVNEIRHEV